MRSLYLPYVPVNPQRLKDAAPKKVSVSGAHVAISEIFQALLKHTTYDRVYLPAGKAPVDDLTGESTNDSRLRFVNPMQLAELPESGPLILFSGGFLVHALLALRYATGKAQSPVVGVTHSLKYIEQLVISEALLVPPAKPFDALICTSLAARSVVKEFITLAREGLFRSGVDDPGRSLTVKLPVIPLGVDTSSLSPARSSVDRQALGIRGSGPVVLYLGRFSTAGKADLLPLLLAFHRSRRLHPDARLVLAGDDTQHKIASSLRTAVAQIGCGDEVVVVENPSQAQKSALFGCADVFVSPADNLQETFGLTLLEAMAAALPVIASDWSGYRDIVLHQQTGLLVPTVLPQYSHPAAPTLLACVDGLNDPIAATTIVEVGPLSDAICLLLGTPELREKFGQAGRRRAVEYFDWRVIIRRYEALWDELAEEGAAARFGVSRSLFDYGHTFRMYPTSLLDGETEVELAEESLLGFGSRQDCLRLIAGHNAQFRIDVLDGVVEVARERRIARIRDLASTCGRTFSLDDFTALAHVCLIISNVIRAIQIRPIPVGRICGSGIGLLQKLENRSGGIGRRSGLVVVQNEPAKPRVVSTLARDERLIKSVGHRHCRRVERGAAITSVARPKSGVDDFMGVGFG
jgi:D-inositol-3-phosphate glycosyltransferase